MGETGGMRQLLTLTLLGLLGGQQAAGETVRFKLDAPAARSVYLAGEMSDWESGKRAMTRDASGRWSLELDLAPGQWLYKLIVDGHWIADPGHADRDADGRGGEHSFVFVGASEQHLMRELLPWLAERYALRPGPQQLGVAGMSMGARGALHLVQTYPDRFAFAYGLSASFHAEQIRGVGGWPRGKALALRCGREDFVFPRHQALVQALQDAGIAFEQTDEPGGHTWNYWSRSSSAMLRWVSAQFEPGTR